MRVSNASQTAAERATMPHYICDLAERFLNVVEQSCFDGDVVETCQPECTRKDITRYSGFRILSRID